MPVDAVLRPAHGRVLALAEDVVGIESVVLLQRDAVSTALFTAVSRAEETELRRTLLALRRDLYNLRSPSVPARGAASALPQDLRRAVDTAILALDRRDALVTQLRQMYPGEMATARDQASQAFTDPDFQSGLVLSSAALFRNLTRFAVAVRRAQALGSREEQIERGLLRYLTRMAAKATPFGRFCCVIPGELVEPAGATDRNPVSLRGDLRTKRSSTRLNKRIYAQLWDHLQRRPAVRAQLLVQRNATLGLAGDRLRFLTAIAGREVFQRLPRNAAVDLVMEMVTKYPGVRFGELAHALALDARCDATDAGARAFLDRLVDLGALRLQEIIQEQEADWAEPLAAFLRTVDDPHARLIVTLLSGLRQFANQYQTASPAERGSVVERMRERLSSGFADLDLRPWFPHDALLYEDATADGCLRIALTPRLQDAFDRLAEWIALTTPLSSARCDMATMRHFFDSYCVTTGAKGGIPLLRFYEDFYREHFKAHLARRKAAERGRPVADYDLENPYGLKSIQAIQVARQELAEQLGRQWSANPASTELVVTREMIEAVLPHGTWRRSRGFRSATIFGQVMVDGEGRVQIVVKGGQHFAGYGKYFSRFLYLLPERWCRDVRDENALLTWDLLAEICGDAGFNANLHPPLLPWEISYPTAPNGGRANSLLATDLEVAPDPADPDALLLRHMPTRRRVWAVDLGFLTPRWRPPLYQLLSRFTPSGTFGFPMPSVPPERNPTRGPPRPPIVYSRPRITYEGALILARRTWWIPQTLFPLQASTETNADYFLRLTRWRREHGIPDCAYVRVQPLPAFRGGPQDLARADEKRLGTPLRRDGLHPESPQSAHAEAPAAITEDRLGAREVDQEEAPAGLDDGRDEAGRRMAFSGARYSRDWWKPQFIDFGNPLLVRLFTKLPGALNPFRVVIEECLPAIDQLPVHNGGRVVVELVLQVNFPALLAEDQDDAA